MGRVRLRDLDPIKGEVELPSGRVIAVYPADAAAIQLAMELQSRPDDMALQALVLRRLIPDASDEDMKSLTPAMQLAVIEIARGNQANVEQMLGESSGGKGEAANSPPSPPTIS